jgi:methyl-accepting chemotaxis protein
MRETMAVMDEIRNSSQRIAEVISVMDEVAFQTNLLAINAAVEAAHAGDAGKGFAVVANEVRGLAQRSADAAKDIRALIAASSKQIASGVGSVGQTGESLQRIVKLIETVDQLVSEFATSAQEQSRGLQSISGAASDMNHVTQQDAAAIEESNTSTRALKTEMDQLAQLIGQFDVGQPAQVAGSLRAPPRMHAVA